LWVCACVCVCVCVFVCLCVCVGVCVFCVCVCVCVPGDARSESLQVISCEGRGFPVRYSAPSRYWEPVLVPPTLARDKNRPRRAGAAPVTAKQAAGPWNSLAMPLHSGYQSSSGSWAATARVDRARGARGPLTLRLTETPER
jgi:hypothetical protein